MTGREIRDTGAVCLSPRTPSLRLDKPPRAGHRSGPGHRAWPPPRLWAQAGAHVVLVSRTEAEIDAAAAEIRADGGKRRTAGARRHRHRVPCRPGRRGTASVRHPGEQTPAPIVHAASLDVTEEDYDVITHPQPARPRSSPRRAVARANGGGRRSRARSFHISSQMGHVGGQKRTVYCMTKHGIEGLTKAMAIDLSRRWGSGSTRSVPLFIDNATDTSPSGNDKAFHADVINRIKLGPSRHRRRPDGRRRVSLLRTRRALITGDVVGGRWRLDGGSNTS